MEKFHETIFVRLSSGRIVSLFRRLISDDEYTGATEATPCFVCETYYRFACYIVIAALLPARFSHYRNASCQLSLHIDCRKKKEQEEKKEEKGEKKERMNVSWHKKL